MIRALAVAALLAWARGAAASECGDLQQQLASLRTSSTLAAQASNPARVKDLTAAIKGVEAKVAVACAPRRAQIAVLPLGYVAAPPGNAAQSSFDPGAEWRPTITTQAGAAGSVVFEEPATLDLPRALHWDLGAHHETLIAVAVDAQITMAETAPGRGSWRIEVKARPTLVPLSSLRDCVAGKPLTLGGKLSASTCEMLARVAPLADASSLPERGRANLIGEWQFGGGTVFELGDEELVEVGVTGPPPRLELLLDLSAPLAGFTYGRKLPVTFEANRQAKGAGAGLRLAHTCGDEACQKQRFATQIWYDRIFGVPFVRSLPIVAGFGSLEGTVTNRLQRPIKGQRLLLVGGGRRIIAVTDAEGRFRFDGLLAGEHTLQPVPRQVARGGPETPRKLIVDGETKAPPLFIDRLIE